MIVMQPETTLEWVEYRESATHQLTNWQPLIDCHPPKLAHTCHHHPQHDSPQRRKPPVIEEQLHDTNDSPSLCNIITEIIIDT
jgi:hypothetical protein